MKPATPAPSAPHAYLARGGAVRKLVSLVGLFDTVRFLWARARRQAEVGVTLKLTNSRISLRPRNSDFEVLMHTFAADGCDTRQWVQDAKVVVDGGANIGLTSLLFAAHYPHAQIVAIEPDAENYRLLCENTASFPNITPLHAALWPRHARIQVRDPGSRSWAFQTEEATEDSGTSCPAVTLRDMIDQHGPIDLLKLDIEGAEWPLFESDRAWMEDVGIIVVELHGPAKEQRLTAALRDHAVAIHVQHEKHVIVKRTSTAVESQQIVHSGTSNDS